MKKFLLVLLAVSFYFTGCASYVPPKPANFDKTKTVNLSVDAAWSRAAQWIAENDFSVTSSDKSGLTIVSEGDLNKLENIQMSGWSGLSVGNPVGFCGECGRMKFYPTQARVSVFITKISETSSKVKCTVKFTKFIPEVTPENKSLISCESNGIIEKMLFDYLSGD